MEHEEGVGYTLDRTPVYSRANAERQVTIHVYFHTCMQAVDVFWSFGQAQGGHANCFQINTQINDLRHFNIAKW